MNKESFNDLDKTGVLAAITNTYKTDIEQLNDTELKAWEELLNSEVEQAQKLGASKIEIESAKIHGISPALRKTYLAVLEEGIYESLEDHEEPELTLDELKELKSKFSP